MILKTAFSKENSAPLPSGWHELAARAWEAASSCGNPPFHISSKGNIENPSDLSQQGDGGRTFALFYLAYMSLVHMQNFTKLWLSQPFDFSILPDSFSNHQHCLSSENYTNNIDYGRTYCHIQRTHRLAIQPNMSYSLI